MKPLHFSVFHDTPLFVFFLYFVFDFFVKGQVSQQLEGRLVQFNASIFIIIIFFLLVLVILDYLKVTVWLDLKHVVAD